jgi:hypothetical protein
MKYTRQVGFNKLIRTKFEGEYREIEQYGLLWASDP